MLRLQNAGYVSIYSKWWRWWPVIKRHGVIGLLLTWARMFKMVIDTFKLKIRRTKSVTS